MALSLEPNDEHNTRLVRQVHPPDWQNPTPKGRYDLVVIGAGTAGLVCAAGAAGLGARVALIERHLMGGDCLNYGCVPSKALLHAAHAAHASGTKPDFADVMRRLRQLRADIAHNDSAERFKSLGVDVFLGDGRFLDERSVGVGDAKLSFKRAVIATGGRAAAPEIPGLREAGYLTNETVFSLPSLTQRLLIIGSGPIGVEMAQAFQRLGSAVTLVERAGEILPREDPEAAAVLRKTLERDGVRVLLKASVVRIDANAAHIKAAANEERVGFDAVLVGVGRAPNVDGLNLDAAKVKFGAHGIDVDDHLRTTNARVFSCGDVCMEKKFTHAADFAARAVIQNALFFGRKRLSALTIPWCTYTSPELAHVGLTAREAEARKIPIDTYTIPLSGVDRAVLEEETEGFFRAHVRKGTGVIVGATFVSPHAGESIQSVVLAMNHGLGLDKIGAAICPYPTQADAIRKAGDLYSRTRLTPRAARLLKIVISLNR